MAGFPIDRRGLLVGAGALVASARLGAMAAKPVAERQFTLTGPGGREIRVSEWKPRGPVKALVLFSHGAASSPRFYEAIFGPWLAAGFHILAPLHVDSTEHTQTKDYPGLASWKARIEDMRTLSAHVGKRPWFAGGHSYGGLVALTMGGAEAVVPEGLSGPLRDANARVVVAFSPPAPIPLLCTAEGYGKLSVPALVQTGTKDLLPGMPTDGDGWRGHLVPYKAASPGGNRYGLVLEGVDHYFGGAICRYDLPGPKQLDRLADATRISTLFVEAHGRGEKGAARRLDALVSDALPVQLQRK